MSRHDLENRLDKLEQNSDRSVPDLFMSWGREAGLDDEEIRAKWAGVVAEAGDDDPMGVVWVRSLKGELFNS